jgi:hypothetical protein
MEAAKSKSVKVLRKLTSPESKTLDLLGDLSNYRSYLEPRRSSKQIPKAMVRDSSKKFQGNKSYLFNKTALGTPY